MEATTVSTSEIQAIVDSPHAYGKVEKFASRFAAFTRRPETGVLWQVRKLADSHEKELTGRDKAARAAHYAVDRIWHWYQNARRERDASTTVVVEWLEGRDPVWVWATLVGQSDR